MPGGFGKVPLLWEGGGWDDAGGKGWRVLDEGRVGAGSAPTRQDQQVCGTGVGPQQGAGTRSRSAIPTR